MLAGVEETRSSSKSEEHQAGMSISINTTDASKALNQAKNVSGNASTQNSDSSSHCPVHTVKTMIE